MTSAIRRFNRFELKYLLSWEVAERPKEDIRQYLHPDIHGDNDAIVHDITGTVNVKPEMREAAIAAALEMSAASEMESGCKTYRFYTDFQDVNKVFLFEEWESEEALAAHFETAHIAAFQQKLPGLLASEPKIVQYEVSDSKPA